MTAALLMTVRPAADTSSDMEVLSLATPRPPADGGRGVVSPPAVALHVLAAVGGVDLTRDERGVGVGEELDDAGDLVWLAEPADGDLGDDLFQGRDRKSVV